MKVTAFRAWVLAAMQVPVPPLRDRRYARTGSKSFGFGVVADVDAFDEVENVFGDVGGVVGDAFEASDHGHQVKALRYGCWVSPHIAGKLLIYCRAEVIHFIIAGK